MKNIANSPSNSRNRAPKIITVFCCFTSFVFFSLVPEGHLENRSEDEVTLEEQQEGRKRMVFDATMYGLLLYGPGTARLLEMSSARQIIGLELLMGGGTFGVHSKPPKIIGSAPVVPNSFSGGVTRAHSTGSAFPSFLNPRTTKLIWLVRCLPRP